MYSAKKQAETRLCVAETEFDRDMSHIVVGTKDAKTITFPGTVRETSEDAFSYTSVQSAVLNERLETIGFGTFRGSKIKKITIPKSVTKINNCAFDYCMNLK